MPARTLLRNTSWLLGGVLAAAAGSMAAPATDCPPIVVTPGGGSAQDREQVCAGAAAARDFLRDHGILVRRRISLTLHDQCIDDGSAHVGLYDADSDRIKLLSYAQARRQTAEDALFGVAMTPELYRSVITHEVSHAIVEQNLMQRPASRIVHEYIAYAAQLSTMRAGLRQRILSHYRQPGYADVSEMSWVYYQLDPSGFGVKAYRHFRSLPEPGRFLRDLISGAVQPPPEKVNGM